MEIEYLENFKKLCKKKKGLGEVEATMIRLKARHDMCRKYSFAIPTQEAIQEISKFSPIVEIGAGSGYWANLLQKAGTEVLAYDKYPKDNKYKFTEKYTNVEKANENILNDIDPSYNLLLCWPNYDSDFAYNALKAFKGKNLIYIGEPEGGCTGNEKFHNELSNNWKLIKTLDIPQWDGIHDLIIIYTKK
jgi:hypothetical protein